MSMGRFVSEYVTHFVARNILLVIANKYWHLEI